MIRRRVVHAYFDYKERSIPIGYAKRGLLGRLLKELSSRLDCIPAPLETAYDDFTRSGQKPDMDALLGIFKSVSADMSSIFFIFDGFDECTNELQDFIIHLIGELQNFPAKFLVTSRP